MENNLQLCPKFINLVSLTLGPWCLDANFYGLIVFLQNSPILEKLTLELAMVNIFLQMYTDPTWKIFDKHTYHQEYSLPVYSCYSIVQENYKESLARLKKDHLHVSTLRVLKSYAWRMIPWSTTWSTSLWIVECPLFRFISNNGARASMSNIHFSSLRTYETSKDHTFGGHSIQKITLFQLHSLILVGFEST